MFDDVLIESAGKDKTKGRGVTALLSAVVHVVIIGAIIAAGYYVKKNPEVIQKPIRAFVVSARAATATSPLRPPAAPTTGDAEASTKSRRRRAGEDFHQPTEIPKEVPQVANTQDTATSTAGSAGGQVGRRRGWCRRRRGRRRRGRYARRPAGWATRRNRRQADARRRRRQPARRDRAASSRSTPKWREKRASKGS